MPKLVRDGSKEHVEQHNPKIVFSKADRSDRRILLHGKAIEESLEWFMAEDKVQRVKELGDLMEVLWAMCEADDVNPAEMMLQAMGKRELRGKFETLWMMKVELDSDRKPPPPLPPREPDRYVTQHWGGVDVGGVGYSG